MGFLWGFLIGRSLVGPRRKAVQGSALPLYGGMLAIVAGIMMAYWSDPNGGNAIGWWLATVGFVFFIIGCCMQRRSVR